MVKQKQKTDNFKEFLAEYKTTRSSVKERPINTSKFTLMQQLKRFKNFSHSESEFEMMDEEIRLL